MKQAVAGLLLGRAGGVERMRSLLKGDRLEQKALRKLEKRPDGAAVRRAVERVKGERWERFRERYGDWGRDVALYVARRRCGPGLRVLGEAAGIVNYYAEAQAIRGVARRLPSDHALRKAVEETLDCIKIQT